MKSLVLFALAAISILAVSNNAQAFTQRETFVCNLSGERIEVQSSLMSDGERYVSAEASRIGSMKSVDCASVIEAFKAYGAEGSTCLLSENGRYMFQFYGTLETGSGTLKVIKGNKFDLCFRDPSASIQ